MHLSSLVDSLANLLYILTEGDALHIWVHGIHGTAESLWVCAGIWRKVLHENTVLCRLTRCEESSPVDQVLQTSIARRSLNSISALSIRTYLPIPPRHIHAHTYAHTHVYINARVHKRYRCKIVST